MIDLSLHAAIEAAAPDAIDGISIGRRDDKSTWSIQFKADATNEQKAAAVAALSRFDPAAYALSVAKSGRLAEVAAQLGQRNAAGFTFNDVTYQIDDASQARITALAVLAQTNNGADWPEGFGFIAADNSAQRFTAAGFVAFATAAAQTVIARRLNARALKDRILAAADVDALEAIDISAGWD